METKRTHKVQSNIHTEFKLLNLSTQNVKPEQKHHNCSLCNEFPICHDWRDVSEIREVCWFRKSFFKYRAEEYNENKRYISLYHANGPFNTEWNEINIGLQHVTGH